MDKITRYPRQPKDFDPDVDWLSIREVIDNPDETLDFVWPGHLAGAVGALVSPGGGGKTMFALQLAMTVATGYDPLELRLVGKDWDGATGIVVFLSSEDPRKVIKKRLKAITKNLSKDVAEKFHENFRVAPLVGLGVDIMSSKWLAWVKQVTKSARLVIIDTLRRFHCMEENDGGQMAELLAVLETICKENGCTILFLHHASKAGASGGNDNQQVSRGSSVLSDNARFQANITVMAPGEAKDAGVHEKFRKYYVKLSFPKANYSAPMDPIWLKKGAGGVLEPAGFGREDQDLAANDEYAKAKGKSRGRA